MEMSCMFSLGLACLSICLLWNLYKLWSLLYVHYIGHILGKNPDLKKFGKWSVITGCTSGIGKSYAYAFAKRGLNLVLISRDQRKLEDLSKDLLETYGVETKIIVVDFSKEPDTYKKIENELKNLDIGILVNNVGILQKIDKYCDIPNINEEIVNITNANVLSHCMMTSFVLPNMVKKDRGLVLFISSIFATSPTMEFQLYGATKAFVDYLAKTLNWEYGTKNLIVQSVIPGGVKSNMVQADVELLCPSADDYVESQLKTIGLTTRTVGYFWHHAILIINYIMSFLPIKIARNHVKMLKEQYFGYQFK